MLSKFKQLKEDMEKKEWTITYKSIKYVVLVRRFIDNVKKRDPYALVKLDFFKANDLSCTLSAEANSNRILIDARTLREYFGIEYSENLGDILEQFYTRFGEFIPDSVPLQFSELEISLMIKSLSKSDSEDPNKIYCYKVRRNPKGQMRTLFNADKTKLRRESLFNYFKDDKSISFCYSIDKNDENDDATILYNFSSNKLKNM
uniref:DUF6037 family protein n=1 Tax=uncultured Veillonella sp. TaxID=159268 RepID=UPI0025FDCED7|nr:DUF6037 family protein [uncultured Veillonella sp.]